MALFQVVVRGATPLCIQLTAGTNGLWVEGWDAFGESSFGTTTFPTLYFPSTPGVGRQENTQVARLDADTYYSADTNLDHQAEVLTVFSLPPSPVEVGGWGSAGVPFRASSRGAGIWVNPGEAVVLYAGDATTSESPHTWAATLVWEEP